MHFPSFCFVGALYVAWVFFTWVYFLLELFFFFHMTQKPLLWVEVGAHAVRKSIVNNIIQLPPPFFFCYRLAATVQCAEMLARGAFAAAVFGVGGSWRLHAGGGIRSTWYVKGARQVGRAAQGASDLTAHGWGW
jgi:hypothetical protein